jgi:hypothetical protein
MKKLFTILTLSLAATNAFADEKGNTNVTVLTHVKMAIVELTGSAAASLYYLLDAPEMQSKTAPGAMIKEGKQITCFMSYGTVGEMISPVVQMYRCSLIVSAHGDVDGNDEVHIQNN